MWWNANRSLLCTLFKIVQHMMMSGSYVNSVLDGTVDGWPPGIDDSTFNDCLPMNVIEFVSDVARDKLVAVISIPFVLSKTRSGKVCRRCSNTSKYMEVCLRHSATCSSKLSIQFACECGRLRSQLDMRRFNNRIRNIYLELSEIIRRAFPKLKDVTFCAGDYLNSYAH